MTLSDVFEKLQAKFGAEKVKELLTPEAGDHYIQIEASAILEVCNHLKYEEPFLFNIPHCISGLDLKESIVVVYHLYSSEHALKLVLHADLDRENPHVPSVAGVWRGANWHERECYDMFGIQFDGHPDLRRILCPDDWEGFPLRKDYQVQEYWHGMYVPYLDREGDGTYVFGREGEEGRGLPTAGQMEHEKRREEETIQPVLPTETETASETTTEPGAEV